MFDALNHNDMQQTASLLRQLLAVPAPAFQMAAPPDGGQN